MSGDKTVKKTILTQESKILADAMNSKYAIYLEGRDFKIHCEERDDGVYVQTILHNIDESFYYPVEARMDYKKEEMLSQEAALFLVDYIDCYFEEYLSEDDDLMLPIDWANYQYDAMEFQLRGQIYNRKIEVMSDKFLCENQAAVELQPNV